MDIDELQRANGLTYKEMVSLATRAANSDIKNKLLAAFVKPDESLMLAVERHEMLQTQDWWRAYQAAFDAIYSLQASGCVIQLPEEDDR